VHVVLLRQRFVEQLKWIDLRTFLDLFALGNALPGPGSTQIAFSIATVTHGVVPGLVAFLCWSLPGAVGMTLLGAGVGKIPEDLHPAVLAALTGLNAAAVGLIALSAEQLAKASATDKLTLASVWASASAGICYHAPWMYPVLIVAGGSVTLVWDFRRWWMRPFRRVKQLVGAARRVTEQRDVELEDRNMRNGPSGEAIASSTRDHNHIPLETPASGITTTSAAAATSTTHLHRSSTHPSQIGTSPEQDISPTEAESSTASPAASPPVDPLRVIPFGVAYALIAGFVLVLAIPLAVRAGLASAGKDVPRELSVSSQVFTVDSSADVTARLLILGGVRTTAMKRNQEQTDQCRCLRASPSQVQSSLAVDRSSSHFSETMS
jgi:chromate transport protein ChrA